MSDYTYTGKELGLMTAMIKNYEGNINAAVNWDQAAKDAGYKDASNAKTMWSRLAKKLASMPTAAAAASGDDDNAGEGRVDAPAKVTKKRKAAGTGEGSPAKTGRATKKSKAAGAQVNAANKATAADANADNHCDAEAEQQGEGQAA